MQDDLIERLRRKAYRYRHEEWNEHYGGIDLPCDADDYGAEEYSVNPDGPEAADRIAALEAKLAEKDALLRECGEALGAISRAVGDWDCRIYASDTEMRHVRATLAKIKDATDAD